MEKYIEFMVPGKPVPYTRVTQRSKYTCKQYLRYREYAEWIQIHFMKENLKSRSKYTEKYGQTSTTSSKACLMPSMASPTKTIGNVSKPELNFVKIKITYL